MRVAEAIDYLIQEEEGKLVDMDQVTRHRHRTRGTQRYHLPRRKSTRSPAAKAVTAPTSAAKAVQRDILPIVEGTSVNTRYGLRAYGSYSVHRRGSFPMSPKPSDMIPELQGRFPIRV